MEVEIQFLDLVMWKIGWRDWRNSSPGWSTMGETGSRLRRAHPGNGLAGMRMLRISSVRFSALNRLFPVMHREDVIYLAFLGDGPSCTL
jgi:hypothetical protein